MKKTLLIAISLVAVFFFAGSSEINAQITWSASVTIVDNSCSCATITSKVIEWEIRRVSDNLLISEGDEDITSASNPYLLQGDEEIIADTYYKICITVKYYDASIDPLCCSGLWCDVVDGQSLIDGLTLSVTMN